MRPLLAAIVTLCFSLVVHADDAELKKQARAHFRAGTAFYEAGDYHKAIAEYEEAYRLLPLPDLVFNLAQAHRLAGDRKTAKELYQKYLGSKSTGPVADEAREHLRELAAQETSPSAAPSPAPAVAPITTTADPPPPVARKERPRWVWFAVGGAAVIVAGVAIGLGVGLGLPPRYPSPTFGVAMPQ